MAEYRFRKNFVYLISILLLSLHFLFLFSSIKAGDIFGGEPYVIRSSLTNVLAIAFISAAVIMVTWKNFTFPASQTSIVAVLSISGFFVLYLPLQYFTGYTYTLLIISAVLFTIIELIATRIPKRAREAHPHAYIERKYSHTKTEALPCRKGKIWGNPLILVLLTLVVLVEELLLNSTYAGLGLSLAIIALIFLPISAVVFSKEDIRVRSFLEVSALVFANRVVLSAFPIKFLAVPSLLPAIYTLVLIACILYIAYRGIDLNYLGLVRGETPILFQVLTGLLTGYILGFIEYFVLRPAPIAPLNLIRSLVYIVVVMMVFVGITEEFLFRGLLQRTLEEMLSPWQAITIASLIFALMHLGWLNPIEIVFAYAAGTIFGLMFHKTKSLIAPIIAHGFGNVVLYTIVLFH